MNKKEIKNLIRSTMHAHIPEQPPRMNWEWIDDLRHEEPVISTSKSWIPHLKLSYGLALMFVLALGLFAVLYQPNNPNRDLGVTIFNEQKEVLSVSLVSTASLIPAFDQELSLSTVRLMAMDTTPIDRIKPYLTMIENLLAQDQGFTSYAEPSDLNDYETKLTITTYDLLGSPITYVFYYNVVSYEKDGDEETFDIRGVMIFRQTQYVMVGKKSIEDDESKLKVTGYLDEMNYIESIYKVEDEESSYEVNRVMGGQLISSSKIKIEMDDLNEVSIEVEIDSIDEISTYEIRYEVEDSEPTIKVEYEVYDLVNFVRYEAEMRIRVKIDSITGDATYSILIKDDDEEFEYESERDLKNDDDEEDEEDEEDDDEEDEMEENDDVEDEEDEEEDIMDPEDEE